MRNTLNHEQLVAIKKCGHILAEVMDVVEAAVRPGTTTGDLDLLAEQELKKRDASPSFKGYRVPGSGVYPASLCTSINDEIVHGLPSKNRPLIDGDIISLDLGAFHGGVHTDMARTVGVGDISQEAKKLIAITKDCLMAGISVAKKGTRIGKIGNTIERLALSEGFDVVRELVGHGIGPEIHLEPQIPNYGQGSEGPIIEEGMALAIEPMVIAGEPDIDLEPDGWTIVTSDGALAAHFEHTIVIQEGLPVIVTR